MVKVLSILSIFLTLISSTLAQPIECPNTQRQIAELWFGRKIGDRLAVTEAKWARFVDEEITPRFPEGLSVVDAKGQWRNPIRNTIVREPSKLVTIVLPGGTNDREKLTQIIDHYKQRFNQQSVALVVRTACVVF